MIVIGKILLLGQEAINLLFFINKNDILFLNLSYYNLKFKINLCVSFN